MIKFFRHLWKEYKKVQKIEKIRKEFDDFNRLSRIMSSKEMEENWGNPVKVWTDLKWKLHCAKNGIIKCDICNKFHREDYKCKT